MPPPFKRRRPFVAVTDLDAIALPVADGLADLRADHER